MLTLAPPMRTDHDEFDDNPQQEDIERLSHETAYCPDCGAQIWDQADVCPKCFAYLGGDTLSRPKIATQWRRKWVAVIVILLLALIILYCGFKGVFSIGP